MPAGSGTGGGAGVRSQFSRLEEEPTGTTSTKRARIQHVGETKRETIIFFLFVGVIALGLGSALTWYGASRDLPDFYIIGPLLLLIGLVLVVIASVFIARVCLTVRRTQRLVRDTEELRAKRKQEIAHEYRSPGESDPDVIKRRPPTTHEIYGNDNEERGAQARRATVVDIAETRDKHRDIAEMYEAELGSMPPPQVTHPLNIAEGSGAADSTFSVPLQKEVAPSGGVVVTDASSNLPGAAVYSDPPKTVKTTKPPLPPSSHGHHGNKIHAIPEEGRSGSASSTGRVRVLSGGRNKVSPSPESGILSPPATPLSRSGVEVEVVESSSL